MLEDLGHLPVVPVLALGEDLGHAVLAEVAPGVLDAGSGPGVDGVDVAFD